MKITIDGPTFYDQEDENIFFGCIYRLPSYDRVVGHGRQLDICFNSMPTNQDIIQLLVVCRRWSIDIEPLRKYKTDQNHACLFWENFNAAAST